MEFLDDFKPVDFGRIPGAIGGVLVKVTSFVRPVTEAPLCHSDHYDRTHFVDEEPAGSTTAQASFGFFED